MPDVTGQADLRAEDINKMVTGFALASYKFKELVMVVKGNAWTETYYRETATELTAQATRNIKGISRGANFPYGEPSWTKVQSYIEKYGLEGVVLYEDERFNNIDVIARTLLRIGRAVAKAVDDQIYAVLSENQSPTNINTNASTAAWDAASGQNPMEDILEAIQNIETYNYDMSSGGAICLSPKDWKSLQTWLYGQGDKAPSISESIVNGTKERSIAGLKIIVSNSVVADSALVVKMKDCGTWKESMPLTVEVINDPLVKKTIRAAEMGVCQLTNPRAVNLITNTQT